MKYFFSLRIMATDEQSAKISHVLERASNDVSGGWTIDIDVNGEYVDFINYFLEILDGKYEKLQEIGIERNNISIWMIYGYDQQCNMEFHPENLKKLGDNGIVLCVSCYQVD